MFTRIMKPRLRLVAILFFGLAGPTSVNASQIKALKNADFSAIKSAKSYAPEYDATAQIKSYGSVVYRSYKASRIGAEYMQAAIENMLASPTTQNLERARIAWINARVAFLQTEAFRFYEGPIDHGPGKNGLEGPEGRINAWPMNEAHIDYVKGNMKAGIINNSKIDISKTAILKHDQATDETDVTTGWHAIEFLLWGQDFSTTGPGQRSVKDYRKVDKITERRRRYLATVTNLLVSDLSGLEKEWLPGQLDNYVSSFFSVDQKATLSRILTSLATLSGFEMANERLAPGLDSGDQEDEHSCFSDTTRNDFIYNLQGIKNIYYGDHEGFDGAGLNELIVSVAPKLSQKIVSLLNQAESSLHGIEQPFDLTLKSDKGSQSRKKAERAYRALIKLSEGFIEAGAALGVRVIVPKG
jgi:putative iron-regulated protein